MERPYGHIDSAPFEPSPAAVFDVERKRVEFKRVVGNALIMGWAPAGTPDDAFDDMVDLTWHDEYLNGRHDFEEALRWIEEQFPSGAQDAPDTPRIQQQQQSYVPRQMEQQRHVGARINPSPADAEGWVPQPFPWEVAAVPEPPAFVPAPMSIPFTDAPFGDVSTVADPFYANPDSSRSPFPAIPNAA